MTAQLDDIITSVEHDAEGTLPDLSVFIADELVKEAAVGTSLHRKGFQGGADVAWQALHEHKYNGWEPLVKGLLQVVGIGILVASYSLNKVYKSLLNCWGSYMDSSSEPIKVYLYTLKTTWMWYFTHTIII